jgi:type II secretory pathway pseudopilin PulG
MRTNPSFSRAEVRSLSHSREAFTLIKVLVVIVVIFLLAAILFPVFGRVRENARRSACQSNRKQLSLRIPQYTQDYDEKWPAGYFSNSGSPGNMGEGRGGDIYPYVRSS